MWSYSPKKGFPSGVSYVFGVGVFSPKKGFPNGGSYVFGVGVFPQTKVFPVEVPKKFFFFFGGGVVVFSKKKYQVEVPQKPFFGGGCFCNQKESQAQAPKPSELPATPFSKNSQQSMLTATLDSECHVWQGAIAGI